MTITSKRVNVSGHNDFAGLAVDTISLPPTDLQAVGGVGEITISWDASFGATSYIIYRGVGPGLESNAPLFTGITGTTYMDVGVPPGTTYYFHVAAVNTSGQSIQSAETFATSDLAAALRVTATTPGAGHTLLKGRPITATFNTDISQTDTLSGSTFTLTAAGGSKPVPAEISYDPRTFTATLIPDKPLVPGTRYTATLSPNIADNNDDFLVGGYSWIFVYATPPTLIAPAGAIVRKDGSLNFPGRSIGVVDPNSNGAEELLTLTSSKGTFTLSSLAGLKIVQGRNGAQDITVQGTLAALNAALENLVYTPVAHYTGDAWIYLFFKDPSAAASPLRVARTIDLTVK